MSKFIVICCRSEHIVTDLGNGTWEVSCEEDNSGGAYLAAVNGEEYNDSDTVVVKAASPEEAMVATGMPKGNIYEIKEI